MHLARSCILRSTRVQHHFKVCCAPTWLSLSNPAVEFSSTAAVQSQRRISVNSEECNEAQKRLNEILDKLTLTRNQSQAKNSVPESKKAQQTAETTPGMNALFERFLSEEDESASSVDVSTGSRSVLGRLTEEAKDYRVRTPQTSVFERVMREEAHVDRSEKRQKSLLGRLFTEQAASASSSVSSAPNKSTKKSKRATATPDAALQAALDGPALSIFTDPTSGTNAPASTQPVLRRGASRVYRNEVLNAIEREQRERALSVLPFSAFDEQMSLTRSGKLWPLPIDNEFRIEEARVHFSEHVFLDRYLDRLGFPKVGPLRRYAELVCLALSHNSQLSARQKRAHLEWLRFYFADRLRVIERYARDEDELSAASESAASEVRTDPALLSGASLSRSDSLSTLLSRAERAANKPDAASRAGEMRTEKRQRKDIIQATRTAERVLYKADAPATPKVPDAKAKKADVKKK